MLVDMAKSMPTANNARRVGRPNQGPGRPRSTRTLRANDSAPHFPARPTDKSAVPKSGGKHVYSN